MLGTIFMNNLIRGDIDSVNLVSRLTFNVPVRLMRNYYPIPVLVEVDGVMLVVCVDVVGLGCC